MLEWVLVGLIFLAALLYSSVGHAGASGVTSEQQEEISAFLGEVKQLVHDSGLVLVSEQPL